MIHIFIGTKAQFIKMAPIMQNLMKREILYHFIDSGQHAGLTGDLIKQFGLHQPDVFLRRQRENISTIFQALIWSAATLLQPLFRPTRSFQKIFQNQGGICLIHGDTLSTLIGLIYAKRCGMKIAHVEAGLRSYNLVDPFPEEIVRLIAMRYSDLLFAPSQWAYENLCKMGNQKKTINIGANTGLDSVRYALSQSRGEHRPNRPYVVFTIHRMETIYSRSRLKLIVDFVKRISQDYLVLFVLHETTRKKLQKYNLFSALTRISAVDTLPLLPYFEFVSLINGAEFLVTDGGSIQEECYYLNKPCMVMRSKTERVEGLGHNAVLVEFDPKKIDQFLSIYTSLKRDDLMDDISPSETIVNHLTNWF